MRQVEILQTVLIAGKNSFPHLEITF